MRLRLDLEVILVARIRVVKNTIGDLVKALEGVPRKLDVTLPRVVNRNVKEGTRLSRQIAREKAGPHGTNYYKRISGEMTGPLSGEYGPTGEVEGNAVGAGYRHGAGNTDLAESLDVIGPKFAKDALDAGVKALP